MKPSKIFKMLALASAGAYAYHVVKENPSLFGLAKTNEEKVHDLINKLQTNDFLDSNLAGIAHHAVEMSGKRKQNIIDVNARRVR